MNYLKSLTFQLFGIKKKLQKQIDWGVYYAWNKLGRITFTSAGKHNILKCKKQLSK